MVSLRELFAEAGVDFGIWLLLSSVVGIFSFVFWKYQHRLPKIPKGYIGFVVAVVPEESDKRAKTVSDFVKSLRDILQQLNNAEHTFYVLELSRYHSRKIDSDSRAKLYCRKCNSRFLVFGNSKIRKVLGKDHHAVNLKGIVSHSPITEQNSKVLAREMTDVLPLDFKVSCENDLAEFEVFSICFGESAKFIIATAAMLSNNTELGLKLLLQLNKNKTQLVKHRKTVPVIAKLITLIPIRLAELYDVLSTRLFAKWRETRQIELLEKAVEYRESSNQLISDPLRTGLLQSILAFLKTRKINNSIAIYKRLMPIYPYVPSIRYGIAFLHAYNGDMVMADKEYEAAFIIDSSFETGFEIEEFIAWILSEEPTKYQLYYCLALINFRIKHDEIATKDELENFLKFEEENNQFPATKLNAIKLMTDINNAPKIATIIS